MRNGMKVVFLSAVVGLIALSLARAQSTYEPDSFTTLTTTGAPLNSACPGAYTVIVQDVNDVMGPGQGGVQAGRRRPTKTLRLAPRIGYTHSKP